MVWCVRTLRTIRQGQPRDSKPYDDRGSEAPGGTLPFLARWSLSYPAGA